MQQQHQDMLHEIQQLKHEINRIGVALHQSNNRPTNEANLERAAMHLSGSLRDAAKKFSESFLWSAVAFCFGNALVVGILIAILKEVG